MSDELSVVVAIPTCYGGASLVEAIKSIRQSTFSKNFKIVVRADSLPIREDIKRQLKKLKVDLTENPTPDTQLHKVKQMLQECVADIFIFTQDDIRFDAQAIKKIVETFKNDPSLTMIGANIQPEPATTRLERIEEIGLRIVHQVGIKWKNGDNYLLSNGRCIAFRTSFLKHFNLPEKMVNTDAYLYFENKQLGGKFLMLEDAIVYNLSPKKIKEHVRQRSRFLFSKTEMQHFFNHKLDEEYQIPKSLLITESLKEFFRHPVYFLGYIAIQLGVQIHQHFDSSYKNPIWEMNLSTRKL